MPALIFWVQQKGESSKIQAAVFPKLGTRLGLNFGSAGATRSVVVNTFSRWNAVCLVSWGRMTEVKLKFQILLLQRSIGKAIWLFVLRVLQVCEIRHTKNLAISGAYHTYHPPHDHDAKLEQGNIYYICRKKGDVINGDRWYKRLCTYVYMHILVDTHVDYKPWVFPRTLRRLKLFAERQKRIELLNARPKRSWTAGVSPLADYTAEAEGVPQNLMDFAKKGSFPARCFDCPI